MSPGACLRRWANRMCSPRTMERLIDPLIADLQHEYEEANRAGPTWRGRVALVRGYLAFWRVLALHVPRLWLNRTVRELAIAERPALVRAVVAAAVTMALVTALLVAPPAQAMARSDKFPVWLLVLLLPQSVPFSLPLTLLMSVVCGWTGRTITPQIRLLVITLGLAGSLVSFGTIVWVVPTANQAWRTIIAHRVVLRGLAETPPLTLRDRALALRSEGRNEEAGEWLFSYHARWALAGAAGVFAVFGLAITGLRRSRIAAMAISASACVIYVGYFFELAQVRHSIFSDERLLFALAWFPNLLMTLTSVAFLSVRDDRQFRSDT
jgi:hypothetical protein